MRHADRSPPTGGKFSRRFTSYEGLFFDAFELESAWIRERATVHLPPLDGARAIVIKGELRTHPDASGAEAAFPGLRVDVPGEPGVELPARTPGPWELRVPVSPTGARHVTLTLTGVGSTNLLAWLGRVTGFAPWQRFRAQNKNRQLRIHSIGTDEGEAIFNFAQRDAPLCRAYVRRHAKIGMNIVGFLRADLGVGESARCMARASDAAGIPGALVPLRLNCKNPQTDDSFAARLQEDNPHAVNVIHVDPPASRDIDHHHGKAFRSGKYNIGYFAWELPDFPDAWTSAFDYFDEIWCPSDFTSAAVRQKCPLPVLTMPHAIGFARPKERPAELRARFGLPAEKFLFLTLFDLNSYAARKNPQGAITAFRNSGLVGDNAALVIKVHNAAGNPNDYASLKASVRDLPGTIMITETLSRPDVYALEAACDCFVSLHRSEGFGLAVAECMYLGKPVISTDWSATAEFVHADNGCPVRAATVALDQAHGPYAKGGTWAEPDVRQAADWMRAMFRDRALAARLGASARHTMETRFSPAVIGARYRDRLEWIATW